MEGTRRCTLGSHAEHAHSLEDHTWSIQQSTSTHTKHSVLMVKCMSVVVNVMVYLMSGVSPPHALCNLSAHTVGKLCTLGVVSLGVGLFS